jgi:hypothetical protein
MKEKAVTKSQTEHGKKKKHAAMDVWLRAENKLHAGVYRELALATASGRLQKPAIAAYLKKPAKKARG